MPGGMESETENGCNMEPGISFKTQVPELRRVESHETSQRRCEEKTSKSYTANNCVRAPVPPSFPSIQCPLTTGSTFKPALKTSSAFCNPPKPCEPIPDDCCADVVCASQICIPDITFYPPEVSVHYKEPTVEMRCWTASSACLPCDKPCNFEIQGTECGSLYKLYECIDRECSMVSHTNSKGKSTLLHAQDSEKTVRKVTCKDPNGMSNTYSKESERKSTTVCCEKGTVGRKPCKDCLSKCTGKPIGETGNGVRYSTKVCFNNY